MSVWVPTATEYYALLARVGAVEAAGNQSQAAAVTALTARVAALEAVGNQAAAVAALSTRTAALETTSLSTIARTAALENNDLSTITSAAALTARVTALEGATPTPGGDVTGVQAARIADLAERFGFNLYPSTSETVNVYGTYPPGNYTLASVTAAYKWITGTTAMVLWSRLWNYYTYNLLTTWAPAHFIATGANISQEVGGNSESLGGSLNKTNPQEIAQLAAESHNGTGNAVGAQYWMKMSEGWNEPNGMGGESGTETTLGDEARKTLLTPYPEIKLTTASLVLGLPNPENYLQNYQTSAERVRTLAATTIYNIHYYPSQNPDFNDTSSIGNDGEMNDIIRGTNVWYGAVREQMCSEWHPTLYMAANPNKNLGRWDDAHDSYLTFIFLMAAYRANWKTSIWYALYDYGGLFSTGMWHGDARVDPPRAEAYVVRAMFQLLGETSLVNKLNFVTSKLDYTITGLPVSTDFRSPNSGGNHMLFQNSDGRFGLFIWNSQQTPGGAGTSITVTFATPVGRVTHYDLTTAPLTNLTPVASSTSNVTTFSFSLTASGHLLLIDYNDPTGAPPSNPLGPSISARATTSLTVAVFPPSQIGGGTLTYVYQRSPTGANVWTTFATTTALTATATGLTTATQYDIRVSATTANGTGPWSAIVKGTTT